MSELKRAEISNADLAYYNGKMKTSSTESSVLVSSSPYLNHAGLRDLIAQEMLRRNGPDMPNTAFIPQVAQILHQLEDMPKVLGLIEEEKRRLPAFRSWLDQRVPLLFEADDVKDCAPGTLGFGIHDFLVHSGYSMDHFFQGMAVDSDYAYLLKAVTVTHDLQHILTGFETDYAGEVALGAANTRAVYNYFCPDFASYLNRIPSYLKAKSVMKAGLYYPMGFKISLDAEDFGAQQGRNWTVPLMMLPYRDLIHRQMDDVRSAFGITPTIPPGHWTWTTPFAQDPRQETMATAAQ